MPEPSWIFILFLATAAMALAAGGFSYWRTQIAKRSKKHNPEN